MNRFAALLLLLAARPSPEAALAETIDAEIARVPGFQPGRLSPTVSDGEWLRRVRLDLVGMPPTGDELRAFLEDRDPDKRIHAVDELLASPHFAFHWARRWTEVFLGATDDLPPATNHRFPKDLRARLASGFVRWLERRIRDDVNWGDVIGQMASATGTSDEHPEIAWKISFCRDEEWTAIAFADNAPRQMLGICMSCARCHDHPFDRWTDADNAGVAAFMARMTARLVPATKERPVLASIREEQTGEYLPPFWRGAVPVPRLFTTGGVPAVGESRQAALGRLLADPANVPLSRAAVNRVWSWLIGRGIVHPVDDFNLKNRPLRQPLLDGLARAFDRNGRSIKFLVRAICRSATYARSSENATPANGRFDGTRALVRPLTPEQLYNSIQAATCPEPRRDLASARRLAFDAAPAVIPGACEVTPVTVNSWLALFVRNDPEVQEQIRSGGVLGRIGASGGTFEEKVDSLFLSALSRSPSPSERARFADFLRGRGPDGLEDAYWALLNSHEFLTRH